MSFGGSGGRPDLLPDRHRFRRPRQPGRRWLAERHRTSCHRHRIYRWRNRVPPDGPLWPDDRRNHHGGGRFRDRRDWRGGWSRATGCGRAGDALVPIALEGPHPASQPSATAPSNRQASRPGRTGSARRSRHRTPINCSAAGQTDDFKSPTRTAGPRALSNELGVAGPRLVWSSARLAARIFMQRRRAVERPLLPRTMHGPEGSCSWA